MKVHRILAISCVVLVSQLAVAEEVAPDPKVLATSEAILAYCAKADPAGASKYQEGVQSMTKGASNEALAKVRKSEEYRQSRESTDGFLAKVDAQNAMKVCSRSLAQSQ